MHIDDSGGSGNYTWLEAKDEPWCNLSNGIYIIENLTIDASDSATGSGIIIGNSSVDFIIRNCSINNAQFDVPDAGIKLNNTHNGTIINNNFYNNEKRAISLENSNNNTISGNHVNKSIWAGIHLAESHNNTISGNIIENVVEIAVKIGNSDDNTLTENTINNASVIGLELSSDSDSNLIYKNALFKNGLHAIDDNPSRSNFWNNSQIGNYWDNYTAIGGIDSDNDGIGDVNYSVGGNAKAIDQLPMFETPLGGDNITIDDNGPGGRTWAWMEFFKFYCTGSGTQSDPYVISDITIDARNESSCIHIQDSNVHFRIEGCTLINASEGGGAEYGGLYMRDVSNGTIINNNFSLNGDGGIIVFNGNNMTITGNFIADNQNYGLYGEPFHNSKLTNNIIDNDGIQLRKSENNTVTGNIVKNSWQGIYVIENSLNNTISGNILDNNEVGIYVLDSKDTVILNNEIINSLYVGILLIESSKTFISYNNISYGQQSVFDLPWPYNIQNLKAGGVSLFNCTNNTIMANYINDNAGHGVTFYLSNGTDVIGNIFNFNILNITYENNSIKTRIEWNLWNKTSVPLIIDESGGGNFTWAEGEKYLLWIRGKGTESNPYLIKDIIINGTGKVSCLEIWNTHQHFRIENCTFYNSGPGAGTYSGIEVRFSSNGTLINNNCSANQGSGMLLTGNIKMNVIGNEIHDNDVYGIYAEGATNYTVSGNNVDLNPIILRVNSNYNNISGNTLTNTHIELEGSNNNVTGNYIYNCSATAIKVQYGKNNNISGNTINNLNYDGIFLDNCSNTYVMGNNITECFRGIMLRGSNNTLITENEIDDSNYGIYISRQCIYINITGNTISDGTINGIYLFNATRIKIKGNLIINHDQDGIYVKESTNILVGANIINLNDGYGVYLESTNDTDVEGNIFNYNQGGAYDNDSYCINNEFDFNVINRVLDPIIIDNAGKGNATWAELAYYTAYCPGTGTESDPYVLSDLIINAEMEGSGIIVNNSQDYFIIKNCDISNSSGGIPWLVDVESGINLINTVNGMIINNTCSNNNGSGIALDTCVNCTVSNNTINNNGMGIELNHDCYNNTISNNTISNNLYVGIVISDSNKAYLEDNTMTNCGMMFGYSKANTHFISTSNTVNGKPLYYYANKTRLGTADYINAGQVLLANCNNSVISDLIIMDTTIGIQLYGCYNNTVFNNTIESTLNFESYGIKLDLAENNTIYNNTVKNLVVGILLEVYSNNNTVKNNTINNCEWGIALFMDCNNNTIFKNKVNNSAEYGIYLEGGSCNIILNNTVNYNEIGIYLNNSHSNFISRNTANYNYGWGGGIVVNNSRYNNITENIVNNNYFGGIITQGGKNQTISGNTALYNKLAGIVVDSENCIVSDNIVNYNTNGVILGGSCRYTIISGNEINYNTNRTWTLLPMFTDANGGGVVLINSSYSTIRANNINFNEGSGIVFMGSNDTVVFGNIFHFNKNGTFSNDTNSFNNDFLWNMVNYTLDPFYIDGDGGDGDFTWHEVANFTAWSMGSGTELDPYVFRDMIIDGGNKSSCIKIDDSNPNVYFTIDNCTLYNCANGTGGNGGIYITDAYNGLIINNNCSYNNDIGIYARSSRNINMSGNIAHFNRVAGLVLYYCNDSVMIGNIANNNGRLGIASLNGINCRVIGNTANNTEGPGIQVSTPDIIVEGNTVANNQWGIHIQTANDSVVSSNILNNNDNGLIIIESTNVTVFENEINFNKNITVVMPQLGQTFIGSGILLVNCTKCTIRTNYINNNAGYALSFYSSNGTEVYGNIMNYNIIGSVHQNNSVNFIKWNAVNYTLDAIHIDENGSGDFTWSEADEYLLWLKGSGTFEDPYLIEGFDIDSKDIEHCITIGNSTVYLRIKDCDLTTSGTIDYAGVWLEYVENAEMLYNDFYQGGYGFYLEQCRNITLLGNTVNRTSDYGMDIRYTNETIMHNNIIRDSLQERGVQLTSCINFSIYKNIIYDSNLDGLYISRCEFINISYNTIYSNDYEGIVVRDSSLNITIFNNTIYSNLGGGIYIDQSANNTISFNNIYDNVFNGISITDLSSMERSNYNRLLNNTVVNNGQAGIVLGFQIKYTEIIGNKVSFNGKNGPTEALRSGIFVSTDSNSTIIIKNFVYNNTANGIYIVGNSYNNISENTVLKNGKNGISIVQSHNNMIWGNTVKNNTENGLILNQSNYNRIVNNTNSFNFNGYCGIFLDESNYNNITGNTANNNMDGIYISGSEFIIVSYNTIYSNDYDGIDVNSNSHNITIFNNMIYSNLQNGIILLQSNNNTIYFNRIYNNLFSGIRIQTTSSYNRVLNNTIINNRRAGVAIYDRVKYAEIIGNNISFNGQTGTSDNLRSGLFISDEGGYCIIKNNIINNNTAYGIALSINSDNNTIIENEVLLNGKSGIYLSQCINITISGNTVYNNTENGIILWQSNNNTISGNMVYNNTINGVLLWQSDSNIISEKANTFNFNGGAGIYINVSNYINITGNTANNNMDGIYISGSNNNFIINNTVSNNTENGLYLWQSHNNKIANNNNSFNFNGKNGIFLKESHFNNITGNVATGNPVGIRLEGSDYNRIIGNDLRSNILDIYESPDCVGNIFQDNILNPVEDIVGVGGDDDDDDGAGPAEAVFDFFTIIIIIIIGVVAAVVVIAVKKSSKKKVPGKVKEKVDQVPRLKAVRKEAPPIMPKKDLKPKKVIASKKEKAGVIAAADTAGLSEAEKKQLAEVESEVDVHREKFICIVHKGPITGDVYICSKCNSFYCVRCAQALKEKGDACWACGLEIKVLEKKKDVVEKIKQLEKRLESLKGTIKNLDESFFSGAISQKEYTTMKDPIAHKITKILAELEKLRE